MIPDNEYFGIIETYLGKVPTPFHKPQLHHALATFFANDEVVQNIIKRIDELDTLLISALVLASTLSEKDLCNMFSETHQYSKVMARVINLEERLIFLPNPLQKQKLFINPLLLKVLKREVVSIGHLFGEKGSLSYNFTHHLPYYIQGLTSFAIHQGREKKKKEKETLLSSLFVHAHKGQEHEMAWQKGIVDFLTHTVENGTVDSLLSHSPIEMIYTIIKEISTTHTLPLAALNESEDIYRFLIFCDHSLRELHISHASGLKRLLYIASSIHSIEVKDIDELCSLLHFFGLFLIDDTHNKVEAPSGIIDTDLSITFHPSLGKFIPNTIHYYAQIVSFDTAIMYQITKGSVCRAFDYHFSVQDIINDIASWSPHISLLLTQQLEHMYVEWEQIKIYDGISVVVHERLEKIIDNYEPLKPYIIKKIASKVFLFTKEGEKKWRDELVKIGIVTLPSTITHAIEEKEESIEIPDIIVDDDKKFVIEDSFFSFSDIPTHREISALSEDLKSQVTHRFPDGTMRDELIAKIEQKIIMLPSQIQEPTKKNAHIKASGFDFNKKLLVVKTAMEHKSLLLDISCLNDDGELDSLIGHPVAYTAQDKNGSVIIKTIPDNKEVVIPIQKIFLIKTIKQSVFFKI